MKTSRKYTIKVLLKLKKRPILFSRIMVGSK
jgi:hypothetical protein